MYSLITTPQGQLVQCESELQAVQSQVMDYQNATDSLNKMLLELSESNEALKGHNAELHSKVNLLKEQEKPLPWNA